MWPLKTVGHQHWRHWRRNPGLSDQLSHGKCTWDRHAAWWIIQYHPLVYDSPTNGLKILHSITSTIHVLSIKSLWNHRFFCPFNPVFSMWKYVKHCETIGFSAQKFQLSSHFSIIFPQGQPLPLGCPKPQPRCSWLVGVRLGWAAAQRGDVVPILQEDQDVLVRLPAVVTPPEKDRKMMEQ